MWGEGYIALGPTSHRHIVYNLRVGLWESRGGTQDMPWLLLFFFPSLSYAIYYCTLLCFLTNTVYLAFLRFAAIDPVGMWMCLSNSTFFLSSHLFFHFFSFFYSKLFSFLPSARARCFRSYFIFRFLFLYFLLLSDPWATLPVLFKVPFFHARLSLVDQK